METAGKGLMGRAFARQNGSTGRVLWTTGLLLAGVLGATHAKLEARHDPAPQAAQPWMLYELSRDDSAVPRALPAVYDLSEAEATPRPVRGAKAVPVRRVVLVYEGSEANAWRAAQRMPVDALRGARAGLSL